MHNLCPYFIEMKANNTDKYRIFSRKRLGDKQKLGKRLLDLSTFTS